MVIPRDARKVLNIRKGQNVSARPAHGVIEVVPDRDIEGMEGVFPGLTLEDIRDATDGDERGHLLRIVHSEEGHGCSFG